MKAKGKGGVVRKGDVDIAKNYLTEQEIIDLNLTINHWTLRNFRPENIRPCT